MNRTGRASVEPELFGKSLSSENNTVTTLLHSVNDLRRRVSILDLAGSAAVSIDEDPGSQGSGLRTALSPEDHLFLRDHATVKSYKKFRHVFEKGDEDNRFFFILAGQVEIFLENDGSRTLLRRKGPAEFFGELSLLTGGPRTASVATIEDSQFAVLHKSRFFECLADRPTLWHAMVRQLAHLVNELTETRAMLAVDAYRRLRFFLYRLACEVDGELVIRGPWTQQHLAELAGCARETVAKFMMELKRGGFVKCERECIVLQRPLPQRF